MLVFLVVLFLLSFNFKERIEFINFHENIYYDHNLSPCGEYKKLCSHCEEARKAISVEIFLKYINKIS